MIKATELRIGNRVSVTDSNSKLSITQEYFFVSEIHSTHVKMSNGLNYIEDELGGIPLTNEWLEKFHFVWIKAWECWHIAISYNKFFSLGKDFVLLDIDIRVKLKYVHQLQNLYFALTGTELKIKQ